MIVGNRTWFAGLMILGLVLAGCNGADGGTNADVIEAPDSATSTSGDAVGDDDAEGGNGAQAPDVEGLTVPLPSSAEAVATSEAGPLAIVQFIVPLDEQQATIAFYDDWTGSQSDDYQRTESESGGVSWQNAPVTGAEKHVISVLSPIEGDDFVVVTLAVGPAE